MKQMISHERASGTAITRMNAISEAIKFAALR